MQGLVVFLWRLVVAALVSIPVYLAVVVTPASAASLMQGGYNTCVDHWKKIDFGSAPTHKVMVLGWRGNDESWNVSCYSSTDWGTYDGALDSAWSRCRREYANCSIFASEGRMSGWVQRISDNGGNVPGERSGGNSAAAIDLFNSFVGAMIGGAGSGGGDSTCGPGPGTCAFR